MLLCGPRAATCGPPNHALPSTESLLSRSLARPWDTPKASEAPTAQKPGQNPDPSTQDWASGTKLADGGRVASACGRVAGIPTSSTHRTRASWRLSRKRGASGATSKRKSDRTSVRVSSAAGANESCCAPKRLPSGPHRTPEWSHTWEPYALVAPVKSGHLPAKFVSDALRGPTILEGKRRGGCDIDPRMLQAATQIPNTWSGRLMRRKCQLRERRHQSTVRFNLRGHMCVSRVRAITPNIKFRCAPSSTLPLRGLALSFSSPSSAADESAFASVNHQLFLSLLLLGRSSRAARALLARRSWAPLECVGRATLPRCSSAAWAPLLRQAPDCPPPRRPQPSSHSADARTRGLGLDARNAAAWRGNARRDEESLPNVLCACTRKCTCECVCACDGM